VLCWLRRAGSEWSFADQQGLDRVGGIHVQARWRQPVDERQVVVQPAEIDFCLSPTRNDWLAVVRGVIVSRCAAVPRSPTSRARCMACLYKIHGPACSSFPQNAFASSSFLAHHHVSSNNDDTLVDPRMLSNALDAGNAANRSFFPNAISSDVDPGLIGREGKTVDFAPGQRSLRSANSTKWRNLSVCWVTLLCHGLPQPYFLLAFHQLQRQPKSPRWCFGGDEFPPSAAV